MGSQSPPPNPPRTLSRGSKPRPTRKTRPPKLSRSVTPMAMSQTEIETMIREAFPDARVEVKDLAGDGNHYAATVVTAAFKGKTRVKQHQMVYEALKGRMGGELHALALTTSES